MSNSRLLAKPLQNLEILVVEDETMLFFLAEDMLMELGFIRIKHASSVDSALAFLADRRRKNG